MPDQFSSGNEHPVVVITGGSSGIGLATAKRFFDLGYRVAFCGRDAKKLEIARSEILSKSSENMSADDRRLLALTCDVANAGQVADFVREIEQQWGRIDIVVNNAAVAPLAAFEATTSADFHTVVNVNLAGPWNIAQAVWLGMVARGSGVIVNVSSLAALDPFRGFSLYGASKAWIETWTKALADEGADVGIRVVGIRPGAVETPLLRGLFPDFPAEQCVGPDEVAATIVDLATTDKLPAGSIVTVARLANGSSTHD